jgi:peptidoglycan/xylan/chitin deacetylase (PgdA/CDA1 family)
LVIAEEMVTVSDACDPLVGYASVSLTFDDGPHPEHTAGVLDVLKRKGIRASFFVRGSQVDKAGTALLRRMRDEGHCIGNHTYSHVNLTMLEEGELREELWRTESLITRFAPGAKLFRPPFGASSPAVERVVAELEYRTVLWNVDPRDWDAAYQPDRWVQFAIDQIRRLRRSVVVAHDVHETTAAHLADLIERLGAGAFAARGVPCSTR